MQAQKIVVLDPGHGGSIAADGSRPNNTTGPNGLQEKDLNLRVAKFAALQLERSGYRVILTRDDDQNLPLAARAEQAKTAGADIFVSIHFNGHPSPAIDGTEVYISGAEREHDKMLAQNLLNTISLSGQTKKRDIYPSDFVVLRGDHHVAKTAAVLVEMAYLSNPYRAQRLQDNIYVQLLAMSLAQGIVSFRAQPLHSLSLAANGEHVIYEAESEHQDPENIPINLPEPDSGVDTHPINIPANLKVSRWEVEILAETPGASYKVTSAPAGGATGQHRLQVSWSYPPYGRIKYRLRVFASPDGSTEPATIIYDSPHWIQRAQDQIDQGVPVNLKVKGVKAKLIHEAIQRRQGIQTQGVARALIEPVTMTIAIVVIIAIVVVIGMMLFAGLMRTAMDKGYDINDTRYSTDVGEGQHRQKHEMVFNLKRPQDNA